MKDLEIKLRNCLICYVGDKWVVSGYRRNGKRLIRIDLGNLSLDCLNSLHSDVSERLAEAVREIHGTLHNINYLAKRNQGVVADAIANTPEK